MADGVSLAIGTAVLKQIYSEGMNEQIQSETVALSGIKSTAKNITNVGGAGVAFTVHFGRNAGIGARGELERLPTAGQQLYARGTTGLKSLYGAIQATGQVMSQAKTTPQSFIDYVGEEMTRIKTDLAKDQNRQVYGDGTGTIGVQVGTTGGTTLAVDDTRYFQIGMRLDLLQFSTLGNPVPTPRNTNYVTVTGIDEAGLTITIDTSIATVTAGDAWVRSTRTSASGTNSWKKEWTGFKAIVAASGTLFGIDPTVYPDWKSTVKTPVAGDGTLTELDLDNVMLDIRRHGSRPTKIFTTPGVYRAYWNALQGFRQFVNKTDFTGGVDESLKFQAAGGSIPMEVDFDAPAGKAWFINEKELALNTNVGWEWIDEQGATWQKIQGYDGFVAELRNYSELTTYRRNAHGLLSGIKEI